MKYKLACHIIPDNAYKFQIIIIIIIRITNNKILCTRHGRPGGAGGVWKRQYKYTVQFEALLLESETGSYVTEQSRGLSISLALGSGARLHPPPLPSQSEREIFSFGNDFRMDGKTWLALSYSHRAHTHTQEAMQRSNQLFGRCRPRSTIPTIAAYSLHHLCVGK